MNGAPPTVPYAGFVTRALALGFDGVVINLALALVTTILGLALSVLKVDLSADLGAVLATAGAWTVAASIYFIGFWTLVGQTPGMRLLGIRVVSADGDRLHVGRALLRLIGMVISALLFMIGFLMVLFDARRRGLHDRIAGTIVLYVTEPSESFGDRHAALAEGQ